MKTHVQYVIEALQEMEEKGSLKGSEWAFSRLMSCSQALSREADLYAEDLLQESEDDYHYGV